MKRYFPELDGLRGIAALTVFFSHAIGLLPETELVDSLQASPLRVAWDGAAAVDLFFVLSGFVLSLPLLVVGSKLEYVRYCIRRCFRIYPAYWLALAVALVLHSGYSPTAMSELSEWAKGLWRAPVTLDVVAVHATLLLKTNANAINPVVWTLMVEMRMALILPLFVFMLRRTSNPIQQSGLMIAVFALAILTSKLAFLPHFALGACLAKNLEFYEKSILKISSLGILLFFIVCLCLYGNRWLPGWEFNAIVQSYITAFSGVMLISLAIYAPGFSRLLKTELFQFFGRTSYGFYLFHLPVLLFVVSLIYPINNNLYTCFLISLLCSYAMAYLSYKYVECPMIAFGKRSFI